MAAHSNTRRPDARAAVADLDAQLLRIASLDRVDLGRLWRELTGERPPDRLPKTLLQRLCARKVQEDRLGGLDRTTERTLTAAARGQAIPERRIKPGSVLVREHGNDFHEVTVLVDGYAWRGERFESLSAVARRITGTSWSGPRFFGLRGAAKPTRTAMPTAGASP